MSIKWLTEDEIESAAEAGDKEAFLCCEHHWWQFTKVTLDEYLHSENSEMTISEMTIYCDHCALCIRYRRKDDGMWVCGCGPCKLDCVEIWDQVDLAVLNKDSDLWLKATKAMHRHIVKKIHELYPDLTIPKHKD